MVDADQRISMEIALISVYLTYASDSKSSADDLTCDETDSKHRYVYPRLRDIQNHHAVTKCRPTLAEIGSHTSKKFSAYSAHGSKANLSHLLGARSNHA